ncbi:hypothetical protein A2U01_0103181, partial [Trifolium medium]|nr:hypothetical protein [Trifolium medium]
MFSTMLTLLQQQTARLS